MEILLLLFDDFSVFFIGMVTPLKSGALYIHLVLFALFMAIFFVFIYRANLYEKHYFNCLSGICRDGIIKCQTYDKSYVIISCLLGIVLFLFKLPLIFIIAVVFFLFGSILMCDRVNTVLTALYISYYTDYKSHEMYEMMREVNEESYYKIMQRIGLQPSGSKYKEMPHKVWEKDGLKSIFALPCLCKKYSQWDYYGRDKV